MEIPAFRPSPSSKRPSVSRVVLPRSRERELRRGGLAAPDSAHRRHDVPRPLGGRQKRGGARQWQEVFPRVDNSQTAFCQLTIVVATLGLEDDYPVPLNSSWATRAHLVRCVLPHLVRCILAGLHRSLVLPER